MLKTALITGSSRGIGRAIAQKLSKNFNIVINYNKSEKDALELERIINQNGGCAFAYKADVSKKDDAKKLVDFTIDKFKRIDVLINNAGIAQQKLFTDITSSEWENMINNNLTSVFNVTRFAAEKMISQKSGKIINISSVWGLSGASCEVHYSASKAGIIGFTKSLAKELAPSNICVNAIAPGVIKTDMCDFDEETMELVKEDIPLKRFGTPLDVANVAEFLSSNCSDYITGEIINVSGGYVI